jgi:hypothetical protein
MKAPSFEARNKYEGAISAGSAALSIGASLPNSDTFSALKVDAINGVHTGPGATPLTLIFLFKRLEARLRVKLTMAPFVEA